MKKKIIILVGLVGLFLTGLLWYGVSHFPLHSFYDRAIKSGQIGEIYQLKRKPDPLLTGAFFKNPEVKSQLIEDPRRWKSFHFDNYKFPLPWSIPLYSFVPLVEGSLDNLKLGFELRDQDNQVRAVFLKGRRFKWKKSPQKQKLLSSAFIKRELQKKGIDEKWRDLFLKDFSQKPVSVFEMIDNLALLQERAFLFPSEFRAFGWAPFINAGYFLNQKDGLDIYEVWLRQGLEIESFILKIDSKSLLGLGFVQKVMNKIALEESFPKQAEVIYQDFRLMSLREKRTQRGLILLFTAWTHDKENGEFFREMISYLEAGKHNSVFLAPLYPFAQKQFGSNFSKDARKLKEAPEVRLERKIQEEGGEGSDYQGPIRFKNRQEMLEYKLREALKKGSSSPNKILE